MASQDQSVSIHQLDPLESGGERARQGFSFQDHVAASLYLAMVEKSELKEVWCETQDDITLIWNHEGCETVEFVQVKDGFGKQLWSVAALCGGDKGKSLLEKSLQYDRCSEPCLFRIVTAQDTNADLRILTHPRDSGHRTKPNVHAEICAKALKSVGDFKSANGHDVSYWIPLVHWQVAHDIDAVYNNNLLKLMKIADDLGALIASDQCDEVYRRILVRAMDAAKASYKDNPEDKKCGKTEFTHWLQNVIDEITSARPECGGQRMADKMKQACLPDDMIDAAHVVRRRYINMLRNPKYLDLSDLKYAEGEVFAALQHLKSQLDCGEVPDEGAEFHHRCLDRLRQLREQLPTEPRPSQFFLDGCMYSVTDRCIHRFRRATR